MDDTDQALISLLRQNARLNVADLAHKLKVSRGTVTNRMRRLEDDQVIVGYTVRLRPEAQPERIRAWMEIQVEGNQTRVVIASLLGEPGVAALHDTNGRWDLLAELEAGVDGRAVAGAGAHPADQRHPQHRDQHPPGQLPLIDGTEPGAGPLRWARWRACRVQPAVARQS